VICAHPPVGCRVELTGPGVGIRLIREGSHDFHSMAELAKTLVTPGMDDRAKAMAVYRFSARNTHGFSAGWGSTEMTRFLNGFGYSFCWGQADFQHLLYEAVGLRARAPSLKGHSSVEVFLDGQWRMMTHSCDYWCLRPTWTTSPRARSLSRDLPRFDLVGEGPRIAQARRTGPPMLRAAPTSPGKTRSPCS